VYTFPEQEEKRTKEMEFSPDGALLAMGVMDGTIRLWDIESRQSAGMLKYPGETDIHDIAFSPNGGFLASGGRVPAVILWNVASGEIVRTFGVRDCVLSVAFSPDGTILAAAAGAEKAILLWDVESGDLLRTLPHNDQCMAITFSPDGRLLAAGCFDGQVYLWGLPANP
jgi:WD40 repeat protein